MNKITCVTGLQFQGSNIIVTTDDIFFDEIFTVKQTDDGYIIGLRALKIADDVDDDEPEDSEEL